MDQCIYCTALTVEGRICTVLYYELNVCFCVCVIGRHSLVLCSFFTGNIFNCRNALVQMYHHQSVYYMVAADSKLDCIMQLFFTSFFFFFFNSFPKMSVNMWTRPLMRCLISFSYLYSKWNATARRQLAQFACLACWLLNFDQIVHVLVSVQHVTVCQSSSVPWKWTNRHKLAEYSQGFLTVTEEKKKLTR